jgi:hypothetical protein
MNHATTIAYVKMYWFTAVAVILLVFLTSQLKKYELHREPHRRLNQRHDMSTQSTHDGSRMPKDV